jgi:hypothetical protein
MRGLTLPALVLLVALCAPCAADPSDDAVIEVPFTLEKGHVIVKATIKDDKPVEVVLSTGSEHSFVNPLLLEKYKLQAFYTGVGIVTGHNDRTVSFTNVPDVLVALGKPTFIEGEKVEKVEVASTFGGASEVVYITSSGRRVSSTYLQR